MSLTSVTKDAEAVDSGELQTLWRVILPLAAQQDTLPLFIDRGAVRKTPTNTMNGSKGAVLPASTPSATVELHPEDVLSRASLLVRAGTRVSFGTYFNAFPASYWRRWTDVESVRLRVVTRGAGIVTVYRSNARGALQRVDSASVSGENTFETDLSLIPFGDGGWYWFDLTAGSEALTLVEAGWLAEAPPRPLGQTTLQITTMNKPDFCTSNLRELGAHPEILQHLKEILVVDQGNKKVQDQPDFEDAVEPLKGKFRIINQANLGGSGGFSRGMYEAVHNGSDYALLMDDDIVVEPESILRLLTFAAYTRVPTLVGGHMFDLYNRTALHTLGETVNLWRFQPAMPIDEQELGHDLSISNLTSTPWMHRRVDVDYNGWWMDLIPTQVIKEIGLALPVFIKWDDVEYGLRAKQAGYPTVSLPGAAVWHISWGDKDDLVGWQAYFHERNRLIAALLYSPYERGGRLVRESNYMDVKHLISMQYYTEAGRILALEDVLAGPDQLHDIQPERIGQIRAMGADYSDGQFKPRIDSFPPARLTKPPRRGRGLQQPSVTSLVPWAAKTLVRQVFLPVNPATDEQPQAVVAHADNRWWRMAQYDSAVVSNAEGTAASWYKRDPKEVRKRLLEATRLHARIFSEWRRLRAAYQLALPHITSLDSWGQTFAKHTESECVR